MGQNLCFTNDFIITRYHPVHNISNFNKKKSTASWTDIRNNIYVAETEFSGNDDADTRL